MNIVQKTINSIGGKTKNLEMLKIFPDYLKTKKICKGAVKKLSFIVRYVHDQLINLKPKKMCNEAVLNYGEFNSHTNKKVERSQRNL